MIFKEMRKIPKFIKRDFRIMFTYKLAFSMTFLNIIFNLFYLILFGSMFGNNAPNILEPYGGDFISYLLVGSVGWGFIWGIMGATATSLSSEMMMGTLESIILTSTRMTTMMISYTIFGSIFSLISMFVIFSVGVLLFNVTIFATASIYTLLIFIFSVTMMAGLGMMFGGLTIWIKNIGSTVPFIQNIAMFFCGVYFPITILPTYLQPIANYIPFYYSIEGLRLSLIPSTPTAKMLFFLVILIILSIFFISLGIIITRISIKKAKKDGSLSFY